MKNLRTLRMRTYFGAFMENAIVNERIPTSLVTHDFYYDLPEELIAQTPSKERDGCRLMVIDRKAGALDDEDTGKRAGHRPLLKYIGGFL